MSRLILDLEQFKLSKHAGQRQQQRGFQCVDMALVLQWGEEVEDGFVLSDRAIKSARKALAMLGRKPALQRLDHLRGMALIEQDGILVTVFRADKKRLRRLRAGHVKAA